jgi:hypothetical protein
MPAQAALHGREPATGGSDKCLIDIQFAASVDPVPSSDVMGRKFLPVALACPSTSQRLEVFAPVCRRPPFIAKGAGPRLLAARSARS